MIVSNIKGGLGNQMFQIAAGYALSKRCGTFFGINYELKHNCIQGFHPKKYKDTLYKNILTIDSVPTETYSEPKFEYTPITKKKDLLIDGYFQSEKYFADCKDDIRDLFVFPDEIKNKVDSKFNSIPKKKIGIHIRRGDYKIYHKTHLNHSNDYLERAMRHFSLERTAGNCIYILCTDDLPSVREEFDLDKHGLIFSNAKSELEDMYILSQCDSVIMSNSSFAWWGTWLGKEKQKVVCPGIWFGPDGPQDYHDVFVHGWEKE